MSEHKTILLIDDQEQVHQVVGLALRREPYTVLNAYDGVEALAILQEAEQVDAILCDQHMPDISGVDLLVHIRRTHPNIPALLITGQPTVEIAKLAINDGAIAGFLPKPWSHAELRAHVRRVLGIEAAGPDLDRDAAARSAQRLRDAAPCKDAEGVYIIDADIED
jgi:DNA-binding NtrC family response regulator